MDMQGNRSLAITQQQAWDALNDPEVLKACIPGCNKLEATGDNQYAVGMALKIGPVSAKFAGKILLSDIVAPASYKINFEGQGGVAGFGKGAAEVKLSPNGSGCGCELDYTVHATVGGKIAQLGQRLIDGTAKAMSEDFFKRFDEAMQKAHPEAYAARDAVTAAAGDNTAVVAASTNPVPSGGMPAWVWVAGAVVVAVIWWLSR
ncbi:CoxG family protein [Hydrogenophaga sp. A37]|uniref:CoxG family protein n=1 Tax=Hydrogenophaga sp. A37 TaxID=1945864 RepID=UPI000985F6B1|nr:carbon monoxide dehydrogenase subunit G [Hydrogenophaga sp. A37]OOG88809.1 carbon monoxide dehydrogenase [Hydrogenophaga sp. A37]